MSNSIYYYLPQSVSTESVKMLLNRLLGATIVGDIENDIQYSSNGLVKLSNKKVYQSMVEEDSINIELDKASYEDSNDSSDIDFINNVLESDSYKKFYSSQNHMSYANYNETYICIAEPHFNENEIEKMMEDINKNSQSFFYMSKIYEYGIDSSEYNFPDDILEYPSITHINVGQNSLILALFKNIVDVLGGYILFTERYVCKSDIYYSEIKGGLLRTESSMSEDDFIKKFNEVLINCKQVNGDDIQWAYRTLKNYGFYPIMDEEIVHTDKLRDYHSLLEKECMKKDLIVDSTEQLKNKKVKKW